MSKEKRRLGVPGIPRPKLNGTWGRESGGGFEQSGGRLQTWGAWGRKARPKLREVSQGFKIANGGEWPGTETEQKKRASGGGER